MKNNLLNKNLSLFISCFAFSCIVSLPKSAVSQQVQSGSFRNFEDWCKNKDVLDEDAKHTINVLLTKIRTSDCKIANEKLSGTWYIELKSSRITNISPLNSFTNLTRLNLTDNQIVDIKPLEKLTKLTELGISDNNISDISPLRNMTNLVILSARRNQITDVSPLKNLTNLQLLFLNDNKIVDVTPLQSLKKVSSASFRRNPIVKKVCPFENIYIKDCLF